MHHRDLEIVIDRMIADIRQERRRREWRTITFFAMTVGLISALIPIAALLLAGPR
jgi:hypothetical protein